MDFVQVAKDTTVDVAGRAWFAVDPRPGQGYGWVGALRTPLLVLATIGGYVAIHYGVPLPLDWVKGLGVAALSAVTYEMGAAKAAPPA